MPSLSIPLPPDTFTLEYRPDQDLLIGRWLRPCSLPEMQASYEAVLAAAQAHHNCHHWLLDVRRRATGDAAVLDWFGQQFIPRLVPALGGSLFVAYFAMITQNVARDIEALRDNIDQGAQRGAHFRYFNREDEALAWLQAQP